MTGKRPPSETTPLGTPNPNPNPKPLVPLEFHPRNPPTSTPGTTPIPPPELRTPPARRGYVYWSTGTWEAFRGIQKSIRKRGLICSSGRGQPKGAAGGRPPISDATQQELIEAYLWKQRVCARAASPRKVDVTAVRSLAALYAPRPFGWLAPFKEIDRTIVGLHPSYRPPKRIEVAIGYIDDGLIRPVTRVGDDLFEPPGTPLPDRVPEFQYARGVLNVQTLEESIRGRAST